MPDVAPANDARASSSPDSSSGRAPTAASARSKNSSRFDRVPRCGGGRHPDRTRFDAEAVHHLPVLGEHGDGAVDRLGGERAVPVDALAEAGDAHQPLDGRELALGAGLGDQEAGGVRADVDRGGPAGGHGASASRSATQRPTGSSPPARNQA